MQTWLKYLLTFVAGVLVGANAVYYVMTHHRVSVSAVMPPRAGVIDVVTEPAVPPPTTPSAAPQRRPALTTAPTSQPEVIAPVPAPSGLIVPVQGITPSQLSDTYSETRGDSRPHEALDIMAPAGTPVLAVADGHVEKLFASVRGGLTIYQFEPSGRHAYYYAHLERYAPGLVEGKALKRGDTIGFVGSSGNANPASPHLHFAIFLLGPERRWWQGTAINPYPLLRGQ